MKAAQTAMPAGPRRKRVAFERRAETDDGAGNKVGAWTPLNIERWAQVKPLGGTEEAFAGGLRATAARQIWVRSDSQTRTLTTDDRVIEGGRAWNIKVIENPDQRDKMLKLICEAGKIDG